MMTILCDMFESLALVWRADSRYPVYGGPASNLG